MSTFAKIMGLEPKPDIQPSDLLVDDRRGIGTEIEVENINRREVASRTQGHWELVSDSSLRPRERSGELIAPSPGHTGKAFIDAVECLRHLECFQRGTFSWRTGTHMHIDVRDKTPEDLLRIAVLYQLVENIFFAWDGHGRHESRFAMPWWVCANDVYTAFRICSNKGSTKQNVRRFSKYTALNFKPISTLGTIEFRHAQGTGNPDKLIEYANMCLGVVAASKADTPLTEIIYEFLTMKRSVWLSKFFPEETARIFQTVITKNKGVPMTQQVEDQCVHSALSLAELAGLEASYEITDVPTASIERLFN